ncbi:MAG: amidohydrolase family protein, partial [Oscillospiraceae bacterium]
MITLIKDANICDGTNRPSYQADILIRDTMIEKIGTIETSHADVIINANHKDVTPGFIDPHRHLDFDVLNNDDFGEVELSQGITTALGGNCGLAPYPSADFSRKAVYDFIEPCLGKPANHIVLNSVDDFLLAVDNKRPHINVGTLVATGALKSAVKGFDKSPYTNQEMDQAIDILLQSLEDGACGISSGIMYVPECYSTTEEFVRLLKPASKYGRVLTTHIRGEGDGLVDSVKEVIEIAKRCELPLNISHLKSVGKRNWQKEIYNVISILNTERANGFDVTADFYPYTGGSTTLMTLIPPSFV